MRRRRPIKEPAAHARALIAELFQVTVPTVNERLKNIFAEGEVWLGPTIRKFRIVRLKGPREVEHHNLDAILAVGYRVRSERGTQFRRWATERLSECPGGGQHEFFVRWSASGSQGKR